MSGPSALKTRKITFLVVGAVGSVILLITLIFYLMFPSIIDGRIRKELSLRKGSLMLQRWSNVELPIYLSVYLFEVTNPDEAEFNKAKPILKERGPYVFLEKRYKEILGFEEDESLIIYKEFTSFYFDRSRSVGSLDDEIMVLNIPVVAAINHAINEANFTDLGYVFIDILKATVDSLDEKLFEIHTIGEMLFTGYRVALFDKLTTMAKEFDMETEEKLANNTFGLLIKKNGTDSGIWKVQTGLEGDAFVVKTWNHSNMVPFWSGDYCNQIRGTDGSSFHPGIEKDEVLHIFHPDICRSAFLEYDTEASIYDVPTYRFIIPDKVFAAPSKYSTNACFCTRREHDRHVCSIDGIQDMSACADGAPIVTSSPHFYGADPKLMKDVVGLNPEKSKHQAYVDVEPTTGAVVNAARRMQVNVEIKNSQEFPILSNVRNMILPVMWIQESAGIDEKMANEFKDMKRMLSSANVSFIVVMVIGFVVAVVGFTLLHSYPYHKVCVS